MFGVLVAHHAHRVGADVRLADVVAPDDADVRLLATGLRALLHPLVMDGDQKIALRSRRRAAGTSRLTPGGRHSGRRGRAGRRRCRARPLERVQLAGRRGVADEPAQRHQANGRQVQSFRHRASPNGIRRGGRCRAGSWETGPLNRSIPRRGIPDQPQLVEWLRFRSWRATKQAQGRGLRDDLGSTRSMRNPVRIPKGILCGNSESSFTSPRGGQVRPLSRPVIGETAHGS